MRRYEWINRRLNVCCVIGTEMCAVAETGRLRNGHIKAKEFGNMTLAPQANAITTLCLSPVIREERWVTIPIGALVAERRVRCVIFFWDPLTPQPYDVDVKALLRLTVLHNVPTACNRVTADFLISSPLFRQALSKTEASDFLEVQRDCDLVAV